MNTPKVGGVEEGGLRREIFEIKFLIILKSLPQMHPQLVTWILSTRMTTNRTMQEAMRMRSKLY